MRIALVSHSNAPWTGHYARAFAAAGHEVCVASYHREPVAGVRTVMMARDGREDLPKRRYLTSVPRLRKVLRDFAPDVVMATYLISNGLAAALAWRGPLLVSAMGADVLDQAGGTRMPAWLKARLLRFVCGRASIVHVVSDEIAETLIAMGVPAAGIVRFSVGVDLARFAPIERIRPSSGPLRIICTRTHDVVYHNDVILSAFARLAPAERNLHLDFVGDGPLLEDRRRQVDHLGLQRLVRFVPKVPNEEMPALLRAADIYVSASSSDGTSASLLEALATGLLPIVTRIRANEPWVRHGENGWLFEVGDPDGLARVLASALDRTDTRERARVENPAIARTRADRAVNDARLIELLTSVARGRS